jgi:hypothetical protein
MTVNELLEHLVEVKKDGHGEAEVVFPISGEGDEEDDHIDCEPFTRVYTVEDSEGKILLVLDGEPAVEFELAEQELDEPEFSN